MDLVFVIGVYDVYVNWSGSCIALRPSCHHRVSLLCVMFVFEPIEEILSIVVSLH